MLLKLQSKMGTDYVGNWLGVSGWLARWGGNMPTMVRQTKRGGSTRRKNGSHRGREKGDGASLMDMKSPVRASLGAWILE